MARIGLLEDNAVIARLVMTMLNHVGHNVTVYEHPLLCMDALQLTNHHYSFSPVSSTLPTARVILPFEVLVLDLHLPRVGGLHILELLKNHTHTRSLPLVFCTAATEYELEMAFRLAPQARLVEKPFKMETLVTAVSTALQDQC